MANDEGLRLSESIRQKVEEMRRLCEGLDEETAARAPEGRWSPKQIISHLCGPEGVGFTTIIKNILEQDTPRVDIDAGNPYFSEVRSRMSISGLLSQFEKRYTEIASFVAGLSKDQLARKAHIPAFKEAPMGEYLTLAELIEIMGVKHVESHINHMQEILKELGRR